MEMHNKISVQAKEIVCLYLASAFPRLTGEKNTSNSQNAILLQAAEFSSKEVSSPLAPQLSISFAFHFLELPSSAPEHKPCKGQEMLQGQILAPQVNYGERQHVPCSSCSLHHEASPNA